MINNGKDRKSLRASIRRTSKIGKRSIYDIITKNFDLSFSEKVDYIRHNFTYYNGNENLFFDEKGHPNKRRNLLNKIIVQVLRHQCNASVLSKFNKKILLWKKEYSQNVEKVEIKQVEAYCSSQTYLLSKYANAQWLQTLKNNGDNPTIQEYSKKILDNLKELEEHFGAEFFNTIRYKELKKYINKKENRIETSKTIKKLTPEEEEQKRVERLMRRYDADKKKKLEEVNEVA